MSELVRPSCSRSAAVAGLASSALWACLIQSGCTVGPDYKPPATGAPEGWVGVGGAGGDSVPTADAPELARWWAIFGDETLNWLIDRAAAQNLDVQIATARVRQARASRTIVMGGLFPAVDAGASYTRSRVPVGTPADGRTGNSFRAGFDASWEIDIFGGIRRGVEAADADVLSAEENRTATLVTLTAELATTYFDLRGFQRQLEVARDNLKAQEESLQITTARHEGGYVNQLDVANAQAQVSTTRSFIPTLEAAVQQARFAIAFLLGLHPGDLLAELGDDVPPLPPLPPEVPVGVPSDLLRRRPDIRAAEARIHAATARIGVATADLFPRFSLTGSFGLQGDKASSLTTAANRFWAFGPAVSWRILDGGQISGNIALQKAITDEALATYRQTVLGAFQEMEDALVIYTREYERRGSIVEAVAANRQAVDLSTQLYRAGRSDFLNVLNAQRSLLATEDALTTSDTALRTDLIAIYKALGGGWNVEDLPPVAAEPAAGP